MLYEAIYSSENNIIEPQSNLEIVALADDFQEPIGRLCIEFDDTADPLARPNEIDAFIISFDVDPPFRARGIGSTLAAVAVAEVSKSKSVKVFASCISNERTVHLCAKFATSLGAKLEIFRYRGPYMPSEALTQEQAMQIMINERNIVGHSTTDQLSVDNIEFKIDVAAPKVAYS